MNTRWIPFAIALLLAGPTLAGDDDARGIVFEAEATSMAYSRADGVRIGFDSDDAVDASQELNPRLMLGWQSADGRGVRARYWNYDERFPVIVGVGALTVEAENLDIEAFNTFRLGERNRLEVSGGIRLNEFREFMLDPLSPSNGVREERENDVDGVGGIVGVELRSRVAGPVDFFVRGRGGVVVGDKFVRNFDAPSARTQRDTTHTILESAIGVVLRKNRWRFRVGGEWQQWGSYSSAFRTTGDRTFEGPSDVGFFGLTASVGMNF